MQRDAATLMDIVLACRDIGQFIHGLGQDEFTSNALVRTAVLRQLEIIGEATKRLSNDLREAHPGIPWKRMAGLRDRLIHAYDDIDLGKIWEIATIDVPRVCSMLEPLLPKKDSTD